MIELRRNDHHANGESIPVLEIWANDALALSVPITENERILLTERGKKAETIEMRLCEQENVILKPGVNYIFSVDTECIDCVNLERAGNAHVHS